MKSKSTMYHTPVENGMHFCVFILSHGRPDNVMTLATLAKCGYTGQWRIIVDNEDETYDRYVQLYGNHVIQFDKQAESTKFDTMDMPDRDRRTIVYARNTCFDIAAQIGAEWFIELDDDYTEFMYRLPPDFKGRKIRNIDSVFEAMVQFLEENPAVKTLAMSQGGDWIGGKNCGNAKKGLLRKAMNSFVCTPKRRFTFIGRINEDVNTYTLLASRGELLITYMWLMLNQTQTQKNKGGMTDVYLDSGTYVKSFFTVIAMPSSVKIGVLHDGHGNNGVRMHHVVSWDNTAPKILNERWKK